MAAKLAGLRRQDLRRHLLLRCGTLTRLVEGSLRLSESL